MSATTESLITCGFRVLYAYTESDEISLLFDPDERLYKRKLRKYNSTLAGEASIYVRPHLEELLRSCQSYFRLAVWSSSSADYAEAVVNVTFPNDVILEFIWARERCTWRYDGERQEMYYLKNLKKLRRRGFDIDRVLIVEDTPKKVERHYGNAIYVQPFFGDPDDSALKKLAPYLNSLASLPNVRRVEKRNWRRFS